MVRCEYSRCKYDVTHEAFCKWNGVTIYFCATHLPKWAVVGEETDATFYRVRPLPHIRMALAGNVHRVVTYADFVLNHERLGRFRAMTPVPAQTPLGLES